MIKHLVLLLIISGMIAGCNFPEQEAPADSSLDSQPKGSLYIIGGGKRPPEMVREMVTLSNVKKEGYVCILPMASSEPDTAFYYAARQFRDQNADHVFNFYRDSTRIFDRALLDSLRNASLIYISGGVQEKFMDLVLNTPIHTAIREAYRKGAMIAGTSAGAAVMGRKMITGNEFKHPEYTGDFRTIEAENIEIKRGLGLLENCIIDQHFIRRMRMNRLIAAAIENPDETCIGIDESTAIIVSGKNATVTGLSQVVVIRNGSGSAKVKDGLLGSEGLELSIYIPGDRFLLR